MARGRFSDPKSKLLDLLAKARQNVMQTVMQTEWKENQSGNKESRKPL